MFQSMIYLKMTVVSSIRLPHALATLWRSLELPGFPEFGSNELAVSCFNQELERVLLPISWEKNRAWGCHCFGECSVQTLAFLHIFITPFRSICCVQRLPRTFLPEPWSKMSKLQRTGFIFFNVWKHPFGHFMPDDGLHVFMCFMEIVVSPL